MTILDAAALFTPPGEGLYFEESAHRYWLDGVELPSVTTILAEAGYVDWSHCTEWARERGSIVHKAIHLELTTGLDWSSIPESIHPYVSAEPQMIADLGLRVVASEVRVFSRIYGYCGTLDRVLETPTEELWLWDTKSGEILDAYGMQTAAYAEALHEMQPDWLRGRRIAKRFAHRLRADGTSTLPEFTNRNDIHDFRAALRVCNRRKRSMERIAA